MLGRLAKFALDQAKKTKRRPARVFTLAGYQLFERDYPAAAWQCLRLSLNIGQPSIDEYLLAAMCLSNGLGRFRDSMALLSQVNERNRAEAEKLGWGGCRFRVLDSVWARHIGHIGELNYVLKLGLLEGRRQEDTILYLPPGSPIANRFLLQQVAARLRLIEDPADLPFPASLVQALHYDLRAPRLANGRTAHYWEIASDTHRRWHQEGRSHLLTLPPEIEGRGWTTLQNAGLPANAWFAALHVRGGKWDGRRPGMNAIRNADVLTYLPAIAEITSRGGWVIRIGDPGMTPLPKLRNVLDYCHSEFRADWMDVFILAHCRFLIGTNSGPAFVPALYGRPAVLTNWWPPAERPWQPSDIFVPKMLRPAASGRYLTLSETLREPMGWSYSRRLLAGLGIRVEDNDPELIRAAVAEMLDRLDGNSSEAEGVSELHARADQVYEARGISGMARLASAFVRSHERLIA